LYVSEERGIIPAEGGMRASVKWVLVAVLAVWLVPGAAGPAWGEEAEKYEFMAHNPLSEVFAEGTSASGLWHIYRQAKRAVENGEYIEKKGIKYTYINDIRYQDIRVAEQRSGTSTTWSFTLTFPSDYKAFAFFQGVKTQMSQAVPVKAIEALIAVTFLDGILILSLLKEYVDIEFTEFGL
jgi:hypothetical protein